MIYFRNVFAVKERMMRKKLKKQKPGKQQKPTVQPPPDSKPMADVKEDPPFDFGGFPARDLKKNLGCG
jgi:hypothetical protein